MPFIPDPKETCSFCAGYTVLRSENKRLAADAQALADVRTLDEWAGEYGWLTPHVTNFSTGERVGYIVQHGNSRERNTLASSLHGLATVLEALMSAQQKPQGAHQFDAGRVSCARCGVQWPDRERSACVPPGASWPDPQGRPRRILPNDRVSALRSRVRALALASRTTCG